MVFLCLILSLLSFGCAGRKPVTYISPAFYAKASAKVAVLPFENQSVDMLAPGELQALVLAGVRRRGYNPMPPDLVQQKLKGVGITDGGQLPSTTPQKLGETLQVDGLFYGTVEDFTFQNVGFVLRRVVKVHLKFVAASTGETLWEDEGQSSHVVATLNKEDAERLFAVGMAGKVVGNVTQRPLALESQQAVQSLLMRLPPPRRGPFPGPMPPPPMPPLPPPSPPLP